MNEFIAEIEAIKTMCDARVRSLSDCPLDSYGIGLKTAYETVSQQLHEALYKQERRK